jgi:hypothetical protein
VRATGFWSYFPVVLLVKTPLPFLALAGAGAAWAALCFRTDWRMIAPVICAAVILAIAMSSRLNIGLRYVLMIYPLLALPAGAWAARAVARRGTTGLVGFGLLLWHGGISASTDPDHLAYFNALAGREPARIVADSDLDWGQDINRLARALRERGIEHVALWVHNSSVLERHGIESYTYLDPSDPTHGWIAVSWTKLNSGSAQPPFDYAHWLRCQRPIAAVGKSIRLYFWDGQICEEEILPIKTGFIERVSIISDRPSNSLAR